MNRVGIGTVSSAMGIIPTTSGWRGGGSAYGLSGRLVLATACSLVIGCYHGLDQPPAAGDANDSSGGGTQGEASEEGETGVSACEGSPELLAAAPLRRLSGEQYANTVVDLLLLDSPPVFDLPSDEQVGGFYSNSVAPVDELTVTKYVTASEQAAAAAALDGLRPCPADVADETACAEAFVDSFGRRAYRRPLAADERTRLLQVYDANRADSTFDEALRLVIQTALQSPNFLYMVEIGTDEVTPGVRALGAYELATRLSYFLWNSMPDDRLLDLADSGALDADQLAAEARRLLDDDRARRAIGSFHLQWLELSRLELLEKSQQRFPEYSPAMRDAMRAETVAFVDHVVRHGDGSLATLLTAEFSFPPAALWGLYGIDGTAVPEGDPVPLPPGQRAGLLTQAAVLAVHAHPDETSIVRRGKLLRENLLCQVVPPPPPVVDNTPPTPEPGESARDALERHRDDPACSGCHILMDELGVGLEHYDAIGRHRTEDETGVAIDASGTIAASDVNGPYVGAVELAARLASSERVHHCAVDHWFQFAHGRAIDRASDACRLDELYGGFTSSDQNIAELLVAIVQTDAFRQLRRD